MYLHYFGLREEPFGVTPDPRSLYLSSSHREALAALLQGIQTERGFMALIAEPGMGKTTLLSEVLHQTRGYAKSVSLFQTQCTRLELLRYMLADIGLEPRGDDVVSMHEQFNDLLISNHRAGRTFLVVIDEAQNLSDEVLESVRLLSDFETAQTKLLQIILAGQPQLGVTLSRPEQSQLRQRMSIICQLQPLTVDEVLEYIETRLRVAGQTAPLFTPEAVEAIAARSGGIPRIINNYCFNLLSLAFALDRKMVDADLVEEVAQDLEVFARTEPRPSNRIGKESPPAKLDPEKLGRRLKHTRPVPDISEIHARSGSVHRYISPSPAFASAGPSWSTTATRGSAAPAIGAAARPAPRPVPVDGTEPDIRRQATQPMPKLVPDLRRSGEAQEAAKQGGDRHGVRVSTGEEPKSSHSRLVSVLSALVLVAIAAGVLYGAIKFREGISVSQNQPAITVAGEATSAPSATDKHRVAATGAPIATSFLDSRGKRSPSRKENASRAGIETQFVNNGGLPKRARIEDIPSPTPPTVAVKSRESFFPAFMGNSPTLPILTTPIGNSVVPGKLIYKVVPKYPQYAHSIEGRVELNATIDEEGKVGDVVVERGPNVLAQAAVAAVRQWRYTPFMLNGKPISATTKVTFNFRHD